jgi:putative Mg2+ transporter-C (MgtC) family protein
VEGQLQTVVDVALAMMLGGAIGIEREFADKPAGLRTHMLVAGAAALLVALGSIMLEQFTALPGMQPINADPIRVVEAIITGISFLGAGTIIRGDESRIEGLTTAASILMVAAIGTTVALEQIWLAASVTVLVLVTLRGVLMVEKWVERKREQREE